MQSFSISISFLDFFKTGTKMARRGLDVTDGMVFCLFGEVFLFVSFSFLKLLNVGGSIDRQGWVFWQGECMGSFVSHCLMSSMELSISMSTTVSFAFLARRQCLIQNLDHIHARR